METVTVDTVEDFLDSIGPNKIIELNPGTYRLDNCRTIIKGMNMYVYKMRDRETDSAAGKL